MHLPCDKIQLDILKSPTKCDKSYDKAQKRGTGIERPSIERFDCTSYSPEFHNLKVATLCEPFVNCPSSSDVKWPTKIHMHSWTDH